MKDEDRQAALEKLTEIGLALERLIAELDEVYDRIARP